MNPSSSASSAGGDTPTNHLVELTTSTLQVVRVEAGAVGMARNAALDNKAILELLLNEAASDWQTAGWSAGVGGFLPATSWHIVTEEQVRAVGADATLGAVAGSLSHGFAGDLLVAGCTAGKGAPVEVAGENRWLIAVAPKEGLDKLGVGAERCKLTAAPAGPGALDHIGAISRLLRVTGQNAVALWELGLERSHLFLVTANGVEAVVPCEVKLTDVWETIRSELNLKYQLAAARLFYGDLFDFTDAAPRIAGALAPALTNALAALPVRGDKPALACAGLTGTQNWLVNHLAASIGTSNWQPDPETALSEFGLHVGGDLLPGQLAPASFGLLHRASVNSKGGNAWKPVWHPATAANFKFALSAAPKPAAAPAPAPAKPAPQAPAPAPKPAAPAPAAAPKPAPIPTPVPAPKPALKTPTPVPRPAQPTPTPTPAPAKPAQPAPAPAPAAKAPAPAPTPAPAKPAEAPKPAAQPAAAPQPAAKAPAPAPTPAPAAKAPAPAPAPAKPAEAPKPAAQPAAAPAKPAQPTPQPAAKAPAPQQTAKPAEAPKPTPQPAAKAPAPAAKSPLAAAASAKVAAEAAGQPAAKKKAPIGLIVGIAALLVLGGGGYFVLQSNNEKTEQVRLENERAVAQAKAEAEKAKKEAAAAAAAQKAAADAEIARLTKIAEDNARKQLDAQAAAQAAQEALARAPGVITITSDPIGAEIVVDGGTPEIAPATITNVNPGFHKVLVRMTGYESVEQLVEIKGAQTRDLGSVTLQRLYGSLMLRSEPADAEFAVYQADKTEGTPIRTGRTPGSVDNLEPGEYVIKFARQGLVPTTEHATISGKGVVDVNSTFIVGGVSLTSNPSGAAVRMNGEYLGVTPIVRPELQPGHANFEFTLPNHEPLKLAGDITNKDTLRLHADLLHVDRIAKMAEVKSPPRLVQRVEPELPEGTKPGQYEVVVSFVVSKQGTVRDIRVEKSNNPALTEPCIKAVTQWKFNPAVSKAGQQVNMRLSIPFKIDVAEQKEPVNSDLPANFRR